MRLIKEYLLNNQSFLILICLFSSPLSAKGLQPTFPKPSRALRKELPISVKKQGSSFYKKELMDGKFSSWPLQKSSESRGIGIGLKAAWKIFKKKQDVIVAVIDTGIDPYHPHLIKNLYAPKGTPSSKNYGVDFSKGAAFKNRPYDQHGHGTHVAGIIKSIFPDVKILSLKYYNPKASGKENLKSTIAALRYAVDLGVDIINYSSGGPESANEERRILEKAKKKGILVITAAGNEKSNIDLPHKKNAYYPASYVLPNILTVMAHTSSLKILKDSNYGRSSVDISAPGQRINSSLPKSRKGYLSGTSQSTAFVSGVAALLKANYPHLTFVELKMIIKKSAIKSSIFAGKSITSGRLSAKKALELARSLYSPQLLSPKLALTSRSPGSKTQRKKVLKKLTKKSGKIHYRLRTSSRLWP